MGWMEFVMGEKSKKESRFDLLKPTDSDFENKDLNQRMASIDALGDFINVRRVKKITLHICESKVPQFEKHMAKFFAKHGYKADISD
jgi:hypothetical protein